MAGRPKGRKTRMFMPLNEEEVRTTGVAQIRQKYNEFAKYYMRIYDRELLYCHNCDEYQMYHAFYLDKRFSSGYYPECKECLKKQATDYDKKTDTYKDNKKKAIEVFRKLDVPFIEKIYDDSIARLEEGGGLGGNPARAKTLAYLNTLTTVKSLQQYDGKTFKDSEMMDDTVYVAEDTRTAREDIKKIFGEGLTESDYLYLQDKYDDWYSRVQIDSISQETLIVQICFVQMNLWKAQKAGKDTKDLIRSLNDLMDSANLKPKQNVNNGFFDTLTFGQMLEKWEETKPITDPKGEFKDCDKINNYISTWFSWLIKALGLKKFLDPEIETEINKYTVTKEISEETVTESNEIYEAIFGKDLN